MTDLTEQWKRGEFIICNAGKCQYYYVRNEEQQEVIKTEYCLFDDNTPNWQILAPVPSYDEWEVKQKSLKVLQEVHCKDIDQINRLKELLKECKNKLICYKPYDKAKLVEEIDQVLNPELSQE